jgi:hypothetical protein
VPGDRDHLEIVAGHVARGERPGDGGGFDHFCAVGLVAEQGCSEGTERSLACDVGLVPVVQVVAGDPAKAGDGTSLFRHHRGAVDEQVALLALQQEGPDVKRGRERQRLGRGGVKAGDHGLHDKLLIGRLTMNRCRRGGFRGLRSR